MRAKLDEGIKIIADMVNEDIINKKSTIKRKKILSLIFYTPFLYFIVFVLISLGSVYLFYVKESISQFNFILLEVISFYSFYIGCVVERKKENVIEENLTFNQILMQKKLTLEELQSLKIYYDFIKKDLTNEEFSSILNKVYLYTKKDSGSAIFHCFLFENYNQLLDEIKWESQNKEVLSVQNKSIFN